MGRLMNKTVTFHCTSNFPIIVFLRDYNTRGLDYSVSRYISHGQTQTVVVTNNWVQRVVSLIRHEWWKPQHSWLLSMHTGIRLMAHRGQRTTHHLGAAWWRMYPLPSFTALAGAFLPCQNISASTDWLTSKVLLRILNCTSSFRL